MYYQPTIIESSKSSLSKNELTNLGILEVASENYLVVTLTDKKTIGVKDVREIILWNSKKDNNTRVILIENAEKLTPQAQNALLKVLEEPNENIQIILVVDNVYNLLITVRSRCRKISANILRERKFQNKIATFFASDYLEREKILESIFEENPELDARAVLNNFLEEIVFYFSENKIESLDKNNLSNMIELIEKLVDGNKRNINLKIIKDLILLNL